MKRDSHGRSFSHQHFRSGTTSSNLSTDATYFLNITKYSDGKGGIDILARYKHHLTVFELKDEFKPSEGPDKVILQALAYATFIVELSKTENGDLFWELCGIRNPKNRKYINVCILMPDPDDGSVPSFVGDEIQVPNSDFTFKLHYMYFDKETVKVTRTSL